MPPIETAPQLLALWAILGYLLGAIPFGIVLSKIMGLGDLRQIGSGNIGATNVLRTGSKTAAALTLILDAAKGAVALLLARFATGNEDAAQLAGLAAMFGHCFPIWLRFKGGKGVATFLGLMLALSWPVGLSCCAAWLFGALMTRISSLAALCCAALSTVFLIMFGLGSALLMGIVLTVLVFLRHRENIQRVKAGTEPRIGVAKT